MTAEVYINQTESGGIEISVVRYGLSSGAARKYDTAEKARSILLAFGFDTKLVDRQLRILFEKPPSVLVKFQAVEIADDVLGSLGFKAAAFMAA